MVNYFLKSIIMAAGITLSFASAFANTEDLAGSLANTPLTLTPKEINKLEHYFKGGQSTFENDTLPEHVVWHQTPIEIILPIYKERQINFGTPIQFGYDKSILTDEMLKIQNNDGVLYLTAKKVFTTQRVEVKLVTSGKMVLLNLSAQKNASNTPLDIVIQQKELNDIEKPMTENLNQPHDNDTDNLKLTPVTLMRFAIQALYAPKRLLVQPSHIFRVPMRTHKTFNLFLDNSVLAMPLASWRGDNFFVTAVLLRNNLSQALALDPRTLCGKWQASSFFPHRQLMARGQQSDSTTVFLVSNQAFAESLKQCEIAGEFVHGK